MPAAVAVVLLALCGPAGAAERTVWSKSASALTAHGSTAVWSTGARYVAWDGGAVRTLPYPYPAAHPLELGSD
ncbi:MAG: hypothetical protein M3340_01210, partial [Actinomycetota bacterium]|nr:hypothetical protein [Actinomycetota bacterium]